MFPNTKKEKNRHRACTKSLFLAKPYYSYKLTVEIHTKKDKKKIIKRNEQKPFS